MSQQVIEVIERLLARAPQWIRHDLLAAMIGAALADRWAAPASDLSAAAN